MTLRRLLEKQFVCFLGVRYGAFLSGVSSRPVRSGHSVQDDVFPLDGGRLHVVVRGFGDAMVR